MSDIAIGIAVLAAVSFLVARYEYVRDNRRDAKVLAGFGATCAIAAAATWLV